MAKKYGKWQVVDSLNEGGQAYLYRVTDSTTDDFLRKKDPSTDDVFVLKRLKNKSRIKLFEQEIRAILGLNHSNVLRLADYDTQGDKPYYVAEYCNLGSLEGMGGNYFKGNIGRAVDVILPIIDALTAAHTAGIVHRDIKPPNILFRKEMTPLIADFGICHMQGDERLTLTDEAKGSINYIAPEMESGGSTRFGPPKPETDGYSIGKVLYWMLSGGLIFSRERHRDRPLTLLLGDQRYEHVHSFLDEVVVEDPGRRIKFNSMAERLRDVRQLVDGGFTPLKPSMGLRCRFAGSANTNESRETMRGRSTWMSAIYSVSVFRTLRTQISGHSAVPIAGTSRFSTYQATSPEVIGGRNSRQHYKANLALANVDHRGESLRT